MDFKIILHQVWVFGIVVKTLVRMPASLIRMPGFALHLQILIPASWEVAGDGCSYLVTVWIELLAPCFGLAWPWLLQALGSEPVDMELARLFSLCLPNSQIKKKINSIFHEF